MIIDLKTISTGIRSFNFTLGKDWWHTEEQHDSIPGLKSPVKVNVHIYRAGDRYVLDGDLSGMLEVTCDRCLEPYNIELSHKFKVFLAMASQETENDEVELIEEDLDVGFITGDELNLDEVVEEQIYLSLPLKKICSEGCLGLCPECGTNLNRGDCGCGKERGHPAFQKLKKLKI